MTTFSKIMLPASGCLLAITLAATGSAQGASSVARPAPSDPTTQAFVEKACSDCHKFTMVSAQHKSADEWQSTVKHMIEIGAEIPESDIPRVVAYLTEHYGPVPAEKPAN